MSTASVHSLENIPPLAAGTPGVADARWLPDASFDDAWNEILMPGDTKIRLARQATATMLLRRDIAQASLPLHGIVLLAGVPGTGKTTVARGLEDLVLEIYDPTDAINDLRGRFDFTLDYSYGGDGSLWADPDTIAFTVKKNGSYPSSCRYRLVATTAPWATDPPTGTWISVSLRSTHGFTRHNVGTPVAGGSTAASLSYYRRVA